MKLKFWYPDGELPDVDIIDNTEPSMRGYGLNYDYDIIRLTDTEIEAIKNGKALASDNGEHSLFIVYTRNPSVDADANLQGHIRILDEYLFEKDITPNRSPKVVNAWVHIQAAIKKLQKAKECECPNKS